MIFTSRAHLLWHEVWLHDGAHGHGVQAATITEGSWFIAPDAGPRLEGCAR
jgi:hypothetical protein